VPGALLVAGIVYVRGWRTLSPRMPGRFGPGRLAAFLGGLGAIGLAVASPLDALAGSSIVAHMAQHQLLMMIAPPLLWLGAPVGPMLRGLPRGPRRAAARALAAPMVARATQALARPGVGWIAFVLGFWGWHLPVLYELALRSHGWHHVEHACFLGTAMLFWRPVILAWPARASWPRWTMIPYLLLADVQNTVLAAILTFADRAIYASYGLADQSLAGVLMWVTGSVVFLLAAVWLVMDVLTAARPLGARVVRGNLDPGVARS
jgi:putative membrane protein